MNAMFDVKTLIEETDYGTPASKSEKAGDADDRRPSVTVPAGTSIMRAAMDAGMEIPKLCATDMLDAFGSCRLCLVEIEGRAGTPASCTTPVADGHGRENPDRAAGRIRKGVMELYISDHPADSPRPGWQRRLRAAGHGRRGRPARGALRLRGRATTSRPATARCKIDYIARDESNPYFTYDPSQCIVCSRCVRACEEVQGTFALTIEGRGFESASSPGMTRTSSTPSACPAAPACRPARPRAEREVGHRDRHSRSTRWSRPAPIAASAARSRRRCAARGRAHGALQGRQGERGPFLREGPLRLGLRHPQGPHHQADDPRKDHRPVARGDVGRGDRPRRLRVQAHPGEVRPRFDRRHHLLALHQRGDLPRPEAGARRASATTTSTPARASATRRPATA